MTRIEKVIREIDELRDFYKRTKFLRDRIKAKRDSESDGEAAGSPPMNSDHAKRHKKM